LQMSDSTVVDAAPAARLRLVLDDSACSYNGQAQPDGSCRCDSQWKGPQCAELNLVPTPRDAVRATVASSAEPDHIFCDPICAFLS
jgi:hypothetical protein